MIKIGLIGFGYWGPNIARNLMAINDIEFSVIIDLNQKSLDKSHKLFPWIIHNNNIESSLGQADAFIIATPIDSHYKIAKFLLENGKHVLIQKPMSASSQECQKLVNLALKYKKCLMVAHTFLFSPSIKKIKEDLDKNLYGKLNYISSTRINLGIFQRSNNVIWDLAPHDFSIIKYLSNERPKFISAVGQSHTNSKLIDCANITIGFDSNLIAMVHLNWLSPIKVRNVIISGTDKMVVYDDVSSEKIKIYDCGVSYTDDIFSYRKGDVFIPKLDEKEAIYYECLEFISNIKNNNNNGISNMYFGLEVVRMIEAADLSITKKGKPIFL